ncbi:MAG TPA: glycosyltransferase [Thermoanaerobaculia bacterium]|jgi:N-acetylglucosaminyl-diphospho-decaprenol L-rhamnosyltransferase|nr:glycosyltransferase [Thermoanaerobaculia bacterium]
MISEITAILVSWKDEPDVLAAVAALAAARARIAPSGPAASLVVVDNGGGRLAAEALRRLWPGAQLIVNAENRGFGPAANQAAASASGDVLLFLNPDTRVEGEPFSTIAAVFATDPRVIAAAPRLVEMDGASAPPGPLRLASPGREDQATFQLRRLPRLGADASELLLVDHAFPNHGGRRRSRYADADRETGFPVEQAAAAALAVRRDAFVRCGGFDERYVPAWYEDVDLCARLAAEGMILYVPGARVRHRGGESASRLGYARFLPAFYGNALRYRREHYGSAALAAYHALLAAGMVLRLALLPFRRGLPRSRADAARGYLAVLGLAAGMEHPVGNPS